MLTLVLILDQPLPPLRRSARLANHVTASPSRSPMADQRISFAAASTMKLNGTNYVHWKREMTMFLRDADLWDIVATEPPRAAARDAAWNRKNNRALLEIFRGCEPAQQDLIEDGVTAHDVWVKFQTIFQAKDAASIQRVYLDFTHLRKDRSESVMHFIARVKSYA